MRPARFVDAHVHFWDLATGWYPTASLAPDDPVVVALSESLGDFSKIAGRSFGPAEYRETAANWNVDKVIHVTCAETPATWVDETRAAQRWSDDDALVAGAIGYVSLAHPTADFEAELEEHMACPVFRGVRHAQGPNYSDPHTVDCLRAVARRELVYDAVAHESDLEALASVARKMSELRFIVEHTGWPTDSQPETIEVWRRGMQELSECENVAVKISGLGMVVHDWAVADLQPWVDFALETFGVERCLFASNFPIDLMYSQFDTLLEAFATLAESYSVDETDALFAGNAERWYDI